MFLCGLFLVPSAALATEDDEREPVVWNVKFEGNDSYRNMVLRQVIGTQSPNPFQKLFGWHSEFLLNETELRRDRIRLIRYYERRGYHNIDVRFEINDRGKDWRKDVVFYISEGEPIRIASSEIIIETDEIIKQEIRESREFRRASSRHEYREGMRYQTIRQPDVEGLFLQTIQDLGFAWPELKIETEFDSLANRADVKILIEPNQKTYFNEIVLEGDISVPERMVIRETDIKPGDLYSRQKIQDGQRQIFNHHLFRFATITIPEQARDSTVNLLVRVREHPQRTVQASVGFGREELVRGQLNWQHRNINGRGHRFGVSSRASFIEQRLGSDYLIPYVFNSRSSNVASVFGVKRLEPAYELLQGGFNNSLIYQISRNKTASLAYEFSVNEELSRNQNVSLPDSVLNYNTSSVSISGYYSQGFSRDPRGWVIQPSAEFSGTFGEASYKFQKLTLDVRRFTPITNSLTFAARVNAGTIFYTQQDSLPANIRFFSGGTNSVRGWNRQDLGPNRPVFNQEGQFSGYVPVGGRALFSFNLEMRQQLTGIIPNVGIAAFLDGGQVWRSLDRMDERPVQFGAGGGLRYQSPIGPVRIDVAYKLNPTDQDLNIFNGEDFGSSWDRIGIHFSIGQAF